jgi:putative esterase
MLCHSVFINEQKQGSMMKYIWILLVLLITFCTSTFASDREETLLITDKRFDLPLSFNVALPKSYSAKQDKRYVLLFDFHPYAKTYLMGLHDWMSHNGEWPWLETIVVTPNYGNPVGQLFDGSGETTPLVEFITKQLLPTIDNKYRTNGFRIMSGFRFNGTIALSTLVTHPEAFNAYIVISPELKKFDANVFSKLDTLASLPRNAHKFVLFSHASTIKEDHQMAQYQTLNTKLSKFMAHNQYEYQDFGQHYFMSLPALSTIGGIEKLFGDIHRGLAADSEISQQGVNAIIAHYKALSEHKYGFEVSPKRSIETLGFSLLPTLPEQGIAVLKENIRLFPKDAYTHHALARAYDQLGNLDKAIEHQYKANELAQSMLTWHAKRQKRTLEEYIAKKQALPINIATN